MTALFYPSGAIVDGIRGAKLRIPIYEDALARVRENAALASDMDQFAVPPSNVEEWCTWTGILRDLAVLVVVDAEARDAKAAEAKLEVIERAVGVLAGAVNVLDVTPDLDLLQREAWATPMPRDVTTRSPVRDYAVNLIRFIAPLVAAKSYLTDEMLAPAIESLRKPIILLQQVQVLGARDITASVRRVTEHLKIQMRPEAEHAAGRTFSWIDAAVLAYSCLLGTPNDADACSFLTWAITKGPNPYPIHDQLLYATTAIEVGRYGKVFPPIPYMIDDFCIDYGTRNSLDHIYALETGIHALVCHYGMTGFLRRCYTRLLPAMNHYYTRVMDPKKGPLGEQSYGQISDDERNQIIARAAFDRHLVDPPIRRWIEASAPQDDRSLHGYAFWLVA